MWARDKGKRWGWNEICETTARALPLIRLEGCAGQTVKRGGDVLDSSRQTAADSWHAHKHCPMRHRRVTRGKYITPVGKCPCVSISFACDFLLSLTLCAFLLLAWWNATTMSQVRPFVLVLKRKVCFTEKLKWLGIGVKGGWTQGALCIVPSGTAATAWNEMEHQSAKF